MKQALQFTRVGIDRSEIAALMLVAEGTTQREVFGSCLTAVLHCDDMIDFMIDQRHNLGYQALLASAFCPVTNLGTQ